MRVIRGLSTNSAHPSTDPFRKTNGIFLELRGGDVNHPLGDGNWFKPPYFGRVFKMFISLPLLPFLSWKFGTWGGYCGFKIYGVDSPAYKEWMNPDDVYDGSQALHLSVRPFATLES
jgi:hypothetical protein